MLEKNRLFFNKKGNMRWLLFNLYPNLDDVAALQYAERSRTSCILDVFPLK